MQSVLEALTDSEQQSLSKIQNAAGDAFVEGVVYNNYNADDGNGLAIALRADAAVVPELVPMFQYVGVVAVDKTKNAHITGDDYFLKQKDDLDAFVPQYAASHVAPSLAIRDNLTGNDTHVTDVELGQYGGRVGVYKHMDDGDSENVTYYLVAAGGAQLASEDLQRHVHDRINGIDKWGSKYTNEEFHECPKQNYVAHVAESNVRRMLYNAADAFGVATDTTLYYNVNVDVNRESYPSQVIPDHMQQIAGMYMESRSDGNILHVYNGVISGPQLRQNEPFYVLEGPADPIHVFDAGDKSMANGVPAHTGRARPLPQKLADVKIDAAVTADYERRCKKVFWENKDMLHPDVAPDAYNRIQNKSDRSFLEKLEKWGWDKTNTHERLYPVCVKISNPFMLRPVAKNVVKTNTAKSAAVVDEFNE